MSQERPSQFKLIRQLLKFDGPDEILVGLVISTQHHKYLNTIQKKRDADHQAQSFDFKKEYLRSFLSKWDQISQKYLVEECIEIQKEKEEQLEA